MFKPLDRRSLEPEWMDQPGLAADQHGRALQGLARINWLSGSSRILWPPLRRLSQNGRRRKLRVLDLACGGGDVTVRLAHRAARAGLAMSLAGCDASETALSVARTNARRAGHQIEFFQADVLQADLPPGYDAVVCSLFLHHLSDTDAEALLRRMGQAAGTLVLVNDLVRSRGGYWLALLASRLLTTSPIVRIDAPLSVRRAFTPAEVLSLARKAGLSGASLSRHWPQRQLLQWWRPYDRTAK